MSYWLGVDLGSTFTAAAICRDEGGRRVLPEVFPLGTRSTAVSSVVYLGEGGQLVVGEAAERRAATQPDRVVREFKRRIGDEVPMVIGGAPYSPPQIAAMVLRWVVGRVAEREGGPAAGIVLTHPASWGTYKIQILADALRATDLPEIIFRTEPEAAAASYALQERVDTGSTIAVYDLGGGTFDAAVVRKTGPSTFEVLGRPQGIEQLGGVDFDDAVFGHVLAAVPVLNQLDLEDPAALAAIAALRRECTEAKEALSADTDVTIRVLAPGIQSQVRLVRAEFEDMIRSQVVETVEALRRALRSAEVDPADLDAVLLVGGSSRVPLVAQLVSAELGRPVAVDADPKAAIALGAAVFALPADMHAAEAADVQPGTDVEPGAPAALVGFGGSAGAGFDRTEPTPIPVPHRPTVMATPLDVEPAESWGSGVSPRTKQVAMAGLLALAVAGGGGYVLYQTSNSSPAAPAPMTTVPPAPPVPPAAVNPGPAASVSGDAGSAGGNDGEAHPAPVARNPTTRRAVPPPPPKATRVAPPITTTTVVPPTTTTAPPPPPSSTTPPAQPTSSDTSKAHHRK